ncbi:ATP-binding cassette domain-containing protein [Microbacterium sp. LTA6]|uniref:ABC transporter ATP-binding protein n=1 Tax=unclassified Microbacterium TaxID=2609290 RepID=UPI00313A366C
MEAHTQPIVSVRGVGMSFGQLMALADVTLDLEQGVCTGLIGPNGSGKSTLVNCLSGLLKPTTGSIAFGGKELHHSSMRARAKAGLARNFQNLRLFDSLTVRENIAVSAGLASGERRASEEIVTQTARLFGLEDDLDARVGDLSWGHRRRVELARVINGVPRYLLLDEPGAGLDLSERQKLPGIIGDLTARGVGSLLVDHDMSLISRVCTRVLVLRQGQLIFDGTPASAFKDPQVLECYLGERHDAA